MPRRLREAAMRETGAIFASKYRFSVNRECVENFGSRRYLAPQTGFALTTTWLTTDPDWRRVESLQFSVFPGWSAIHVPVIRHSCRFDHVLRSRSSLTGQYAKYSPLVYPSLKGERGLRNTTLGRLFHIFLSNPRCSCACSTLAAAKSLGAMSASAALCCRPRHRQLFPCRRLTTTLSGYPPHLMRCSYRDAGKWSSLE